MVGKTNLQRMIKKMKLTLTALTLAATLFAGSASAFDPNDLQKLKYTNKCKSCDLSGANLHSADLSRANLKGAILTADLEGAVLNGANLMDVMLCNTTMPEGSFNDSGC